MLARRSGGGPEATNRHEVPAGTSPVLSRECRAATAGAMARNEGLRLTAPRSDHLATMERLPPPRPRRNQDALRQALGQRLTARDFVRQVVEFRIRVAVLNGYTALGYPSLKPLNETVRGSGNPHTYAICASEPGAAPQKFGKMLCEKTVGNTASLSARDWQEPALATGPRSSETPRRPPRSLIASPTDATSSRPGPTASASRQALPSRPGTGRRPITPSPKPDPRT